MQLPLRIDVQLRADAPVNGGLSSILVSLDISVNGSYYYGSLVGLTDATGRVGVAGAELAARFQEDRRLFTMDYKVPLEECDDTIQLRIASGKAFQEAQLGAKTGGLVSDWARKMWASARNTALRPASVSLDLRESSAVELRVRAV